jgi:hypothetical protein
MHYIKSYCFYRLGFVGEVVVSAGVHINGHYVGGEVDGGVGVGSGDGVDSGQHKRKLPAHQNEEEDGSRIDSTAGVAGKHATKKTRTQPNLVVFIEYRKSNKFKKIKSNQIKSNQN